MAFSVASVKPALLRGASARRASHVARAADRPMWLPGNAPPAHLDGSLAGDYGFDPLGLGSDPERLKWYAEAEKTNGRWAMAAVLGCVGQEILRGDPKWFEAGARDYDFPLAPLLAAEFLIMGFLELKRYQGWKQSGTSGFIDSFPFDPLGMNSPQMQTKEVKNGRLAMIAFVGFAVQALVTREGPLEGLFAHMSNPVEHNIFGNIVNIPKYIQ